MSITLAEAREQLNVTTYDDDLELGLYVDAANAWIATRVPDTSLAPVRLASLFLVDHWWESQRGPVGTPLSDEGPVVLNGRAYAIPNRVLELLGPFLSTTIAVPMGSFPDAVGFPDPVEWPV